MTLSLEDYIQGMPKAELHVHLEGTLEPEDFFELAYHYFQRAVKDNIVYVEPFFDPQGHTSRGVEFDTIITGIHRAQVTARENLGINQRGSVYSGRNQTAQYQCI